MEGLIRTVKADGKAEYQLLAQLRSRSEEVDRQVTERVSAILADVRARGDEAVLEYSRRFDKVVSDEMEIPREEINEALQQADPDFISSLLNAQENIATFHARQKRQSFIDAKENGVILGQRVRGLAKVGVYVPGGTAAYPSSVLMNVVPAKIAEVEEIIMVTPPGKDGKANPDILAAAAIAGVDRIFLVGGAQAVAALAYGTQQIPKVDKIVGPGNLYVATAKKLLYGQVDIDMIAGPSEILVVADDTADPLYVAADMMSQCEHDPLASATLITTSPSLAKQVEEQLALQVETLSRKEIILKSLRDFSSILICDSIEYAISLANYVAPEHLEMMVADPLTYVGKIDNAGSVFLGQYAPEPLGDYFAGPNHVLPTSGTARFFSPLSVDSFVKRSSFIYYPENALQEAAGDIVRIAEKEGLTAHANSIKVRFPEDV